GEQQPAPVAALHLRAAAVAQRHRERRVRRPLREQLGHARAEPQRPDRALLRERDAGALVVVGRRRERLLEEARRAGEVARREERLGLLAQHAGRGSAVRLRGAAAVLRLLAVLRFLAFDRLLALLRSAVRLREGGLVFRRDGGCRGRRTVGLRRRRGRRLGPRRSVAAALGDACVDRDLLVDEVLDAVGLLDA